ncbi:MGMT family protein [Candidatus Parvarchaeota archaeon]|nr:MGMT family protein [Candidatus Parvarchaeota archaeon]
MTFGGKTAYLTKFQKSVLDACRKIPKGKTATYGQIAVMVGNPNAARAVGSVLAHNPFAPSIPCHRVIRSDGALGNYSASGGRGAKAALLKKEGAI